jgi:integrase
MLSSALSDARREGLIRHNPAADASVPKEQRAKVNPWSGEELGRFLDHAGAHRLGAIFELMAMAGLRRGEAVGLRWSDVNVEHGFLVVRQQLVATDIPAEENRPCRTCGAIHRGLLFGPPKTANGEARRVDLGQTAMGMLLVHRLTQDGQRSQLGAAYADHDLVFAEDDGNPWHPNYVTKTFTKITRDAGLRRIRLHDLRHGRASLMLAAGIDITVVSKMLGHASIRTTADTYSHLLEGVGKAAAEAADSLIVRQPRDQSVTNQGVETVEAPFGGDRKGPLNCSDDGGAEGTRTPDPLHAMQMRYQLRHSPRISPPPVNTQGQATRRC